MRKIRSRLTIIIYLLVIFSSAVSLILMFFASTGRIFQRDEMRLLFFGYAIKDVLLLVAALGAMTLLVFAASRSTTNPIRDLTAATREITAGNFNVEVDIRDRVDELRELQDNFNLMAAELRSNETLRKDFISDVSHELKTPLSILNGYAQLLEEGGLSPEDEKEYAGIVAAEAEKMTALVNNMLRLARIDSRKLPLKMEPFPLGEQLRQAVLALEPRWSAAGLEIDASGIEDVVINGDRELLDQVWRNLIDNAVKYTPSGGTVSVAVTDLGASAAVTVRDTGIGMDEETLSRAFEQFFRGDSARSGEGSGLGLALARRITELHDGTIDAVSCPGEGSTFTVTLPKDLPSDHSVRHPDRRQTA